MMTTLFSRVGTDIPERLGKLLMWDTAPLQAISVGVESDLEDSVAAFHADALILVRVFVQG